MQCPSCGHPIEADQRHAHLVVCGHCASAVVLDHRAARVAGKMAVLAAAESPLFVGASGTLKGRSFQVLGRVRYGHTRGFWDEWYLAFAGGETAWIGEDEGNYTLATLTPFTDPVDYALIQPGSRVTLGGHTLHVDEKDIATCEGAEGQLPFRVLSGEKTPFVDLSGDGRFATLEFDLDDPQRLFMGRSLALADLNLDATAAERGARDRLAVERRGDATDRERIVKRAGHEVGIKCPSCAAPLPVPGSGADTVQCTYCEAVLDLRLDRVTCPDCGVAVPLTGGERTRTATCRHCHKILDVTRNAAPEVLAELTSKHRPPVPFTLGQACRFEGIAYRVIGHIRFVERDAWGVYRSDEFMLFNAEHGYCWLVQENGHFSLSTEIMERPATDVRQLPPKSAFSFRGRRWRVFESGTTTVEWVEGELPWVATLGDTNHYVDAIAPPYLLSGEWTATEAEWYEARYLWRDDVAEAFDVDAATLGRATGVAPHALFSRDPKRWQAFALVGVFGGVYLLLLLLAWVAPGRSVASFQVSPQEYASEFVTDGFEITDSNALCKATFAADVDNAWVYLDVAVIDDHERALLDFSAEMSHYHGVEGGESWREGSGQDSVVFRLDEPGTYHLLIAGQAGTGEQPSGAGGGQAVRIAIFEGARITRYYILGAVVCLGIVGIEWLRRHAFETRRWADSDADDDDD